jgi:hypothetical protein
MQSLNFCHKLNLHWCKAIILIAGLAAFNTSLAQNESSDNLGDYDNQWIHYGFQIGLHQSKYRIKYSDTYTSSALDTLHSVIPGNLPGWKVGFVSNMRLLEYLDFRALIMVGFYEHDLTYRFTDGREVRELKDATLVEIPLLLKYKSVRRGNVAMYMLGGINTAFEAAGKGDEFDIEQNIVLRNWNISIDAGVGFDLYFPLFKFSPEIRYTWGLRNMLSQESSVYTIPLKKLTYQNIAFYISFEGGPSYLRKKKNKRPRR